MSESNEQFLEFIETPTRSSKPREKGLTMMMPDARSITQDSVLEKFNRYIDIVKILDTNFWAPAEPVEEEIKKYQSYDIQVQVGGLPYELARMQNKEEEYLNKMRELDISWIEFETHVDDSTTQQIGEVVDELKSQGFNVVGEIGSKWYYEDDTRLDVDTIKIEPTIEKFKKFIEAGCEKVYWEGLIVTNLIGKDLDNRRGQKALLEVAEAVGYENIGFEVWAPGLSNLEHARYWAWLIKQFGNDVNIANVSPHAIPLLESIRRGTMYEMNHPYIRWLHEGRPTENWWQMETPPYDVGLERD